eukprot:Seg1470.3 transcript_id=Seg1470.3/GoldUCD/mRNA.D3Y31 product="DNA damage-regulated autophagy modulator protein 2" protein_id=Seg1470.3/GoldUCD/D3Y31
MVVAKTKTSSGTNQVKGLLELKRYRHFDGDFHYEQQGSEMVKQSWTVDVSSVKRKEPRNRASYVVSNPDTVQWDDREVDRPTQVPENDESQQGNETVDGELSDFVRRWRNGNILIMMLPIFAGVMPAIFMLGAFLHAADNNSLILKNNTKIPYISDIGNHKPHSSVFTLGLCLSAVFGLALIIVRYFQVEFLYEKCGSKANYCSLICGIIAIIGEIMVASFQLSSQNIVHYFAAFLHFFFIMVYMCMQTFVTYRNLPYEGERKLKTRIVIILRAISSSAVLLCLVLFGVFLLPSLEHYNRNGNAVAQGAEWAMLSFVILFLLTFLHDFRSLTCRVIVQHM